MKKFLSIGLNTLLLLALLFLLLTVGKCIRPHHFTYHARGSYTEGYIYHKEGKRGELGKGLYPTGSSLPDCSHACGPCFPCKRVKVSIKCSAVESCPIVYRCMCRGKYYHVPSN